MKKKIIIVGIGSGNEGELTLGALKALKQGKVVLRTKNHGVVPFLKKEGISFTDMDDIYESSDTFEEAYLAMKDRIIDVAQIHGQVVIAVPGHPMIGEGLVFELIRQLEKDEFEIDIIPGISRADGMLAALGQNPGPKGFNILMASELELRSLDTNMATMVLDIGNPLGASEVKLTLLRAYPPDFKVYIFKNHGEGIPSFEKIPLYHMDRLDNYDYSTCLYLPPADFDNLKEYNFYDLVDIMDTLRSPKGCPWDREQTHKSLRQYFLEEVYEVLEAIDLEDFHKVVEELGDVLLQVVFHSHIGNQHGEFDIGDVITGICRKMIDRHPHIFGEIKVRDSAQVLDNWEKIKKKEKGLANHTQSLKDVPPILPSLMRAYKVQKKAALVGFDWEYAEDAVKKVEEELGELKDAYKMEEHGNITEELGDLLFSVVNVARFLKVEPELALKATIEKFIKRFEYVESMSPSPLEQMSLEAMDILWKDAKTTELEDFNV